MFAGFSWTVPWIRLNSTYDKINVQNQISDENSVLNFYQKMIALRKSEIYSPVLVNGSFDLVNTDNKDLFVYTRNLLDQTIMIIFNWSNNPAQYNFGKKEMKILINNSNSNYLCNNILCLEPWGFLILEVRDGMK